jgi:hypothetical protein
VEQPHFIDPNHIDRADRRLNLASWLVLAIALGYLLLGVGTVLTAYAQPTDGWQYSLSDNATIVLFSQGGAGPLQPGDRVTAIAGVAFDTDAEAWVGPPRGWRVGSQAAYTVVRNGASVELVVPLVQRRPIALLRYVLLGNDTGNLAALASLLIGFIIFALRPRDLAAQLLLLILIYFMGQQLIWTADTRQTVNLYPWPLYAIELANACLWPLMWVMVIHLVLSFPVRKWPLTRHHAWFSRRSMQLPPLGH